MEWLPIESAPKDGRDILLYRPGWMSSMCVGYWNLTYKIWRAVEGPQFINVTHWTPLPPPPTSDPPAK